MTDSIPAPVSGRERGGPAMTPGEALYAGLREARARLPGTPEPLLRIPWGELDPDRRSSFDRAADAARLCPDPAEAG